MTHRSHMTADAVFSLLDDDAAVNPESTETADPELYVLHHPELGVFVGLANGQAYWSMLNSGGTTSAVVFLSPEDALDALYYYNLAGTADMTDAVEIFKTPSGHWTDLETIGLTIADMAFNEPNVACFASQTHH